jgi:A118 family predicted phage portal protein
VNISAVIDLINKERGTNLDSSYYEHIERWRSWWKGYNEDFHRYYELWTDGKKHERHLYSLRMGKQVCSDWASILLNEKTTIVVGDNVSTKFLQGDDGTGGVLGAVKFWSRGNELVEKAFATGTGAVVLRLKGMAVAENGNIAPSDKAKIGMVFLPAGHIIPLTVREGEVIDVAFVSEVLEQGETYIYLETHELTPQGYKITNRYFKEEEGTLKETELPAGIAKTLYTGDGVPLFYLIRPNLANNIDENTALGVSVFSEAIDALKGVDLAFNNFCGISSSVGKKYSTTTRLPSRTIPVTRSPRTTWLSSCSSRWAIPTSSTKNSLSMSTILNCVSPRTKTAFRLSWITCLSRLALVQSITSLTGPRS